MPDKIKQVPLSRVQRGLDLVVAYSRLVPTQIEQRTGLKFQMAQGDLGGMDAAAAETSSGKQFGLYRLHNAPLQEHTTIVVSEETHDITDALDEILECLEINTDEIRSFHPNYAFRSFKIFRRDDAGRVFTEGCYHSRSDAILASKKLAAIGSSQTFWLEPDKSDNP